jgi:hypothetical protein
MQPASLIALVTGIAFEEALLPYLASEKTKQWGNPKAALREVLERHGVSPSYGLPSLFRLHGDLYCLMANHEYGVSALDADGITAVTLHARREIDRILGALRREGGPWRGIQLVATGSQIGIREGRRIHGRYTVVEHDLREGKRHPDGIFRVSFGVDVHSIDPGESKGSRSSHSRPSLTTFPCGR